MPVMPTPRIGSPTLASMLALSPRASHRALDCARARSSVHAPRNRPPTHQPVHRATRSRCCTPLRTEAITKLKEELQDLRTKTSIETQYLHAESRARGETSDRSYTRDERAILDEIERLRKQLDIEKRVNADSEEFLRRKYQLLAAENEEWSTRYDTDLEERKRELDALETARASDLVKLNQLRESYEKDIAAKRARDDATRAAVRRGRIANGADAALALPPLMRALAPGPRRAIVHVTGGGRAQAYRRS
jgi:hypothetical protein